MSDEIKPALSKEEWDGGWLKRSAFEAEWDLDDEGFALLGPGYALQVDAPADLHALAALALHGQDFGFTHAHLKALRTTCDNAERWINARLFDPRDQEALDIARQARDIIAALLPPETP